MPFTRAALKLQNDARLVALTRDGSDQAFEAIVERYRAPLLHYCRRSLDAHRAEDVVQQAFINSLGALRADDRAIRLKPWLYAVTHNLTVNALEKRGWDHAVLDEALGDVPQAPDLVEQGDRLRKLVKGIGELPARQRSAIVLRELEGRSYEEIAGRLEASQPIVRQLLHRARTRLRNACGLLLPLPLLRSRLALGSPPGVNAERVSELVAAAGASGGLIKAGAAVLAAGAIATGGGLSAPAGGPRARAHASTKQDSHPVPPAARQALGAPGPARAGASGSDKRQHEGGERGREDGDSRDTPESAVGEDQNREAESEQTSGHPGPGGRDGHDRDSSEDSEADDGASGDGDEGPDALSDVEARRSGDSTERSELPASAE